MTVSFNIPGKPEGKGRPRFAAKGKYVQTYTPEKTAAYEELVRLMWRRSGSAKLSGNVWAVIAATFPIPKSATKAQRAEMETGTVEYPHKPDADNIAKIVLDALNGLAYDDDSQITTLSVSKYYGPVPRVNVTLVEADKAKEAGEYGT